MVDVDGFATQGLAHAAGQNLHVPRQHHQVHLMGFHQLQDLVLLRLLGLGWCASGQGKVMEGNVVAGGELVEVGVIGDDAHDLHGQQTAAVAKQQVIQAMADFGHHDQHAGLDRRVVHVPSHLHGGGQFAKSLAQFLKTQLGVFVLEVHPHEKQLGLGVAKLGRVEDVAAVIGQKTRDPLDDAALVLTGQGEDGGC